MKKKLEKSVLAEGETTGHAHRLSGHTEVFETDEGTREFETNGDTLTHEEHKPTVLPPGTFESDRVLEYDPAVEEARRVQD